MTELSPAAQAVLSSYMEEYWAGRLAVAAALEALADQVVPANGSRRNNEIRAEILGIAAELRDFLPSKPQFPPPRIIREDFLP